MNHRANRVGREGCSTTVGYSKVDTLAGREGAISGPSQESISPAAAELAELVESDK